MNGHGWPVSFVVAEANHNIVLDILAEKELRKNDILQISCPGKA